MVDRFRITIEDAKSNIFQYFYITAKDHKQALLSIMHYHNGETPELIKWQGGSNTGLYTFVGSVMYSSQFWF